MIETTYKNQKPPRRCKHCRSLLVKSSLTKKSDRICLTCKESKRAARQQIATHRAAIKTLKSELNYHENQLLYWEDLLVSIETGKIGQNKVLLF